jgi:hypothetical protein
MNKGVASTLSALIFPPQAEFSVSSYSSSAATAPLREAVENG